ncbi:MAG: polysaccharide biosynthesis tyrosine autokinase [Bacteroidetes bacterium]|nr:polysaccharide biosynthesis tyrosine autokinase [Bacteroidota bacterium]
MSYNDVSQDLLMNIVSSDAGGEEGLQRSGAALNDVLMIIMKNKWLIMWSFILFLAGSVIYVKSKSPVYQAKGVIFVDKGNSAPQVMDLLGAGKSSSVGNDVEILRSRVIAQQVAARIMSLPAGDGRVTTLRADVDGRPATLEDVVRRLTEPGQVKITPRGKDVNLVDITVSSSVPSEAALVANLYAEAYAAFSRQQSRGQYTATRQFLEGQVERVDTTLRAAENQLIDYATGAQTGATTVAPEIEAQQALVQRGQLESRRTELEIQAAALARQIAAYQGELRRLSPRLAERIASTDDASISEFKRRLAAARAELEDYYARNPSLRLVETLPAESAYDDVRRLRAQVTAYNSEIERGSERIVGEILQGDGLALSAPLNPQSSVTPSSEQLRPLQELSRQILTQQAELNGVNASLGIIQGRLSEGTSILQRLPQQSVLLDRLKRDVGTSQEAYVDLVRRYNEARIVEQSQLGDVTILDQAISPIRPIRPVVPLNLALGSLLGLLLGIGVAIGRYATDTRIRRPEDVRKAGGTLLSLIPDMQRLLSTDFGGREAINVDGHTFATSMVTVLNPSSPIADNYRRLRTNLRFLDPDNPPSVLCVSSPGPGEGKSVTALNLAVTIAQAGHRVVYVDADLRRPMGHRMIGVPREPGLSDILFEGIGENFEGFASPIDDLYIIPAGSKVANPSEVLASNRMREFVEELRHAFEFVVIDTAPVMVVTDALTIGHLVDGTVVVCSANETPKMVLSRALESLEAVGAKVAGVVLNRYDPRQAYGGYAYAYSYGYGYSYSYNYGYYRSDSSSDKEVVKPVSLG